MPKFKIKLADIIIDIDCIYDACYKLCTDYLTDEGEADIHVNIDKQDIEYERKISTDEENAKYSDAYLETLAVYRKIASETAKYGINLMHGAVIAKGNNAYMFTAPSGTGKTTHIKLWLKNIEGSYVINGDKPLLKIDDEFIKVYGTPWCGKENLCTNTSALLKAVVILKRSKDNSIREIKPEDAAVSLIQQTYRPYQKDAAYAVIKNIEKLSKNVRFFELECNMEDEAALCSYNMLKGL